MHRIVVKLLILTLQDHNFFVSNDESIKLDQSLASNPNVGGFGLGDA